MEDSLCFISDDLTHDVSFVYEVMSKTAQCVKEHVDPGVQKLHYFSDGCAGQYNNCKNFLNLCFHDADFPVPGKTEGCQCHNKNR